MVSRGSSLPQSGHFHYFVHLFTPARWNAKSVNCSSSLPSLAIAVWYCHDSSSSLAHHSTPQPPCLPLPHLCWLSPSHLAKSVSREPSLLSPAVVVWHSSADSSLACRFVPSGEGDTWQLLWIGKQGTCPNPDLQNGKCPVQCTSQTFTKLHKAQRHLSDRAAWRSSRDASAGTKEKASGHAPTPAGAGSPLPP